MKRRSESEDQDSSVADFYNGKTIFVTGAAGFLGVVLLEILLRCCPGIRRIYILLREKKGIEPECRKDTIFKKKIFEKLKEKQPEVLEKVHVIAGDVSLPNLGMSSVDALKVAQEASIVFHCAATISFLKPLRFSLIQNAIGTDNVVEFCRKLKQLDVLVYTSTAYSNCNQKDEIEETIYRLPLPAPRYLNELRKDNEVLRLTSQCSSQWPNFYTFSKCLAENILADKASDLPIAIIRPSIIVSIWKGIVPGYVEEGSGMVGLALGIGKGFIRVLRVDTEKKIDHIPVDVVANSHIVAAWSIATNRAKSPLVINCTSGEFKPCTWGEYAEALLTMPLKHPLPKSYQSPSLTICRNSLSYWLLSIYEHYIPAYVIDCILQLSARKPRLVSLYRFFDKSIQAIHPFVMNDWKFCSNTFRNLGQKMKLEDSKVFYVDLDEYRIDTLIKDLPYGAPFYQWDTDKKQYEERMQITYFRSLLTTFIKWVALSFFILLLYVIISKIV